MITIHTFETFIFYTIILLSSQKSSRSLYRQNSTGINCIPKHVIDRLPYYIELEKLLTPPTFIHNWIPPSDIDKLYQDQAIKFLKPWSQVGFLNNSAIYGEYPCLEAHDEPIVVQYIDGKLYFNHHPNFRQPDKFADMGFMYQRRAHALHAISEVLQNANNITDFEAVICVGDGGPSQRNTIAFGLVASSNHTNFLPLSEMEHDFSSFKSWEGSVRSIKKWRDKYPWESRHKVPIYRGNARTCHPTDGDEFAKTSKEARIMLEMKILKCGRDGLNYILKNCIPASYAGPDKGANKFVPFNRQEQFIFTDKFLPLSHQEQFKYILYAEGHYGWANRMKLLLGMQNAVIMQYNEGYYEWYHEWLVPWVHYIPVDHLFTSLPEVVLWAQQNDDLVKAISSNADKYFDTFLSAESMKLRIMNLLRIYSNLFKYQVTRLPSSVSWQDYLFSRYVLLGAEAMRAKEWD